MSGMQAQARILYIYIYIYIYTHTRFAFVGVDNKLYKINGTYTRIENTSRCYLLFYCTSYILNMFRALLCPSSGARDYNVDYHIGRSVLGLVYIGG